MGSTELESRRSGRQRNTAFCTCSASALKDMGARLRALRTAAGWTQAELGRPFSKGYVSQVENGRVAPSLALLSVAAARLGTPIECLVPEADGCWRAEDVQQLWAAAQRLGRQGEIEDELAALEQAVHLADHVADVEIRALAQLRWAEALRRSGRSVEAIGASMAVIELLGGQGPAKLRGRGYHVAALAHQDRGDLEQATRCFEKALGRLPGRDAGRSAALIDYARLLLRYGQDAKAEARALAAVELSRQYGDGLEEAKARLLRAEIHCGRAEPQAALPELAAARAILAGFEDARLRLRLAALEALAAAESSREGDGAIEATLAAAEAAGDDDVTVTLCSALVERRLGRGEFAEAAQIAALGVRRAQRARDWPRLAALQARAALALVVLDRQGDAALALLGARETFVALRRTDALRSVLRDIAGRVDAAAPILLPLLAPPPN